MSIPTLHPRDPETIRLFKHVRALPNARWTTDYLAAARILIDRPGVDTEDRRVNTSLPKSTARWLLPITLNHRYVLAAVRIGTVRMVGAIWAAEFDKIPHVRRLVVRAGRFNCLRGEGPLEPPCFVQLDNPRILLDNDDLREGWLEAAQRELDRAAVTPYRRHHSHTAFRFLTNQGLQDRVLASVFADEDGRSSEYDQSHQPCLPHSGHLDDEPWPFT